MMMKKSLIFCLCVPASYELITPASAQVQKTLVESPIPFIYSRGRNVSVLERSRPELQALGVPVQSFLLTPKLDLGVNYTDNVYQSSARTDDVFFAINPSLAARSTWSRHLVALTAGGAIRRYAKQTPRNEEGWNVGAAGRLDVGVESSVNFDASTARQYESQFSGAAVAGFASPNPYQRSTAAVRGNYVSGPLRVVGVGEYARYNFLPAVTFAGTRISQDNRDRDLYRGTGQVEYGISPDTSVFVQAGYARTTYDQLLSPGTRNRDSTTIRAIAGVSFDLSSLLRGSVGVGYTERRFDAPIYRDAHGISAEAQVEYFPSQITTVTLTGRRLIEDSSLFGTGGYYNNGGSVRVDHEVLRNVLLRATADYEVDDYIGADSKARIFRASGGGRYIFNRNMALSLDYTHGERHSQGLVNGPVFAENRASATLSLQI